MKYYKLVQGNEIIGIANSDSFIKFSPKTQSFLRANEETGEYINWRGLFYRATWMKPIRFQIEYTTVLVLETKKEEYDTLAEAFKINDTIQYEREEQEQKEQSTFIDPVEMETIDFVKASKISEMSLQCRRAIEAGIDIELRMETKHFSMDTQDQLNLMSLGVMAQTQELIPYHADGETCIFYTADEINQIVTAATAHKVYHTTYYNALKNYINSLSTIEEIAAITYGTPIPDEYQSEVLKVITQ